MALWRSGNVTRRNIAVISKTKLEESRSLLVIFGMLAGLSGVACNRLTESSATEGKNKQWNKPGNSDVTQGSGCEARGAQAQFKDGTNLVKMSNGKIAEALVVKVGLPGQSLAYGPFASYVQNSISAPAPSQSFNALGTYGKDGQPYGYSGGSYQMTGYSQNPATYDAAGNHVWSSIRFTKESSQQEGEISLYITGFYGQSVRVGQGRRFDTRDGKDIYLIYPSDGSCWGVLAQRGSQPGMSNNQQHSIEGGSFAIWIPRDRSGNVVSNGPEQSDEQPQAGKRPQQNQQSNKPQEEQQEQLQDSPKQNTPSDEYCQTTGGCQEKAPIRQNPYMKR